MTAKTSQTLADLDKRHVWHPFTPMRQWMAHDPLIIERARGFELIDTDGRSYIDGVSSLWCNVHGHRVPQIDQAIRDQLDKVAHTTLLGLCSPPSIELAAKLVELTDRHLGGDATDPAQGGLTRVFYSDAGATALEVAFKMAVGYWHHQGRPGKQRFLGLAGAYHGDTVGSMSVGYSELFHRPFASMVFEVDWFPAPDICRLRPHLQRPSPPGDGNRREADQPDQRDQPTWPSEDPALQQAAMTHCLDRLRAMLETQADRTAAVVIEPVMQGAAGMVCQPAGFVRAIRELCDEFEVLLIADEVATGIGRTGAMFACEHDPISPVTPDIMCLAKGLTGGYLPVAATMTTEAVHEAFCGELHEKKTLYHGHTYTGNPLGCAAAIASLELFETRDVLAHATRNAQIIKAKLDALRDHPHILDIRQRGLMVGIELCRDRSAGGEPFDFAKRTGAAFCDACREKGLIIRPLGDVVILMPAPAMDTGTLERMLEIVLDRFAHFAFEDFMHGSRRLHPA